MSGGDELPSGGRGLPPDPLTLGASGCLGCLIMLAVLIVALLVFVLLLRTTLF